MVFYNSSYCYIDADNYHLIKIMTKWHFIFVLSRSHSMPFEMPIVQPLQLFQLLGVYLMEIFCYFRERYTITTHLSNSINLSSYIAHDHFFESFLIDLKIY